MANRIDRKLTVEELEPRVAPGVALPPGPVVMDATHPIHRFTDADGDDILLQYIGPGQAVLNGAWDGSDISHVGITGSTAASSFVAMDMNPVGGSPNTMTFGAAGSIVVDGPFGFLQFLNPYGVLQNTHISLGGNLSMLYVLADSQVVVVEDAGGNANQVLLLGDATNCQIESDGATALFLLSGNGDNVQFNGGEGTGVTQAIITGNFTNGSVFTAGGGAALVQIGGNVDNSQLWFGANAGKVYLLGTVTNSDVWFEGNADVVRAQRGLLNSSLFVSGNVNNLSVFGPVAGGEGVAVGGNATFMQFSGPVTNTHIGAEGACALASFGGGLQSSMVAMGTCGQLQISNGVTDSMVMLFGGGGTVNISGGMNNSQLQAGGVLALVGPGEGVPILNAFYLSGGMTNQATVLIQGSLGGANISGGMQDSGIAVLGNANSFVVNGGVSGAAGWPFGSVLIAGNATLVQVSGGLSNAARVQVGGVATSMGIYAAAGGPSVDATSQVMLGGLRASLTAVGEMAGQMHLGMASIAGVNSGTTIVGNLTGQLTANQFGNVVVTGSFLAPTTITATLPGQANFFMVGVRGGTGFVSALDIFTTYINYVPNVMPPP